jgi:hypothetical protein
MYLTDREAWRALADAVATIRIIRRRVRELPDNIVEYGQPESVLADLWSEIPRDACPIDPRRTLGYAVGNIDQCLGFIAEAIKDPARPTAPPPVLATVCRTVLLAAVRVLLIVGPADRETRVANMLRVMRQESDSFQRFMANVTTYEHLKGLVPPEGMAPQQKNWHDALAKMAKGSGGEYRNVNMAAQIIDDLVRSGGFDMTEHEGTLAEMLVWAFNVYSGAAHAFGWLSLVGPPPVPGDFVVDLRMCVSVSLMAIDRVVKAHRAEP